MGDVREFVTWDDDQKAHFKVTSNAINFEIKGRGGASVGLARSLKSPPEYLITFDTYTDTYTITHSYETKKLKTSQNILSTEEYRGFWISWEGSAVKLGEKGCGTPILKYICKANYVIKYVTFSTTKRRMEYEPVHWKIELPPARKTPRMKSISGGELHWVPINAETVALPDDSLIGGFEKEIIYIIRAHHEGSLTPGKYVPSEHRAYITWGGEMYIKNEYEILCGHDCMWVPSSEDNIPLGAVVAGYSEETEHEKLYVGRAKNSNHIIPGKVQPSYGACFILNNRTEIGVANFEILVVPQRERDKTYVNTISLMQEGIEEYEDDENDHAF